MLQILFQGDRVKHFEASCEERQELFEQVDVVLVQEKRLSLPEAIATSK